MTSENAKEATVGLPPGTKIGKYSILERIGMGGQAIVYKAYDALLDRHVAIKQISTHLAADEKFLERFRREAQILAKLGDQSAIVMIYELLQDPQGLFIVMEYVSGHTLEDSLRDNPGPVETPAVLAILWRLAAGLRAVHETGIIHRDIKPGNIIVSPGLKCKITDFGVAATSGGQTSMVLGTTKYMAPELYGGKNVDARADIYSLGFIAYEMLIGREKFNEVFADVVRDKHSEALRWMKWHGNESLKIQPANEVNPEVPKELSEIVQRMLAKDPQQRYVSMEEVGNVLKANFSPKALAAREAARQRGKHKRRLRPANDLALAGPPDTAPLPPRDPRRKKIMLIAAAAAALLLLIAAGAFFIINARDAADQARRDLEKDYAAAQDGYDKGNFAKAAGDYDTIAKDHSSSDAGMRAKIMMHLALARAAQAQAVALRESAPGDSKAKWELAADEADKASQTLKSIQQNSESTPSWVGKMADDIQKVDAQRVSSRLFNTVMDKARKTLASGNFADARDILASDLQNRQINMADPENTAAVTALMQQINSKEFTQSFDSHMRAADDAMKANNFDQAGEELTQCVRLIDGDLGKSISATQRDPARERLKKMTGTLSAASGFWKARAEAYQLIRDGKKSEAIDKLEEANRLKNSKDVQDRIAELRSQVAYDQGAEALRTGKFVDARKAFQDSIRYKDNQAAKDQLAKLDQSEKLANLAAQADQAFGRGDFASAQGLYEQMLKIDPKSSDTADKVKECKWNLKFMQAKKLAKAGKYDDAANLLNEIRPLLPDRTDTVDKFYAQVRDTRKYEQHMEAARAASGKKDWSGAREELDRAKQIKAAKEIETLRAQTYYQENVDKGKTAFKEGRYVEAGAFYKVARKYVDTDEVKDLIKQAEAKVPI